ncbi:MAG: hypothetical protein WAX66_00280 [Patescibacteria group bacterium]
MRLGVQDVFWLIVCVVVPLLYYGIKATWLYKNSKQKMDERIKKYDKETQEIRELFIAMRMLK